MENSGIKIWKTCFRIWFEKIWDNNMLTFYRPVKQKIKVQQKMTGFCDKKSWKSDPVTKVVKIVEVLSLQDPSPRPP